ncbi:tyrosine-type recombinase/integrase [Alkalihalobacillus deserti]|uniref:tyrosine-type recombinase/integrase n=1 Tax=Alkalihalobacillus deserti TaxID=2879466 RepID=UPI001D132A09|nr:site-specific integrase [Alkalihalobacillus deserti]
MTFNQEVSKQGSAQVAIQQLLEFHNMEELQMAALSILGLSGDTDNIEQENSFQNLTVEESFRIFYASSKFKGLADTSQDTYEYEGKLFRDFIYKKFGSLDVLLTEVIYPTSTLLDYLEQSEISTNTSAKKAAFLRTFIKTVVQDFYLLNKEDLDGTLKVDWNKGKGELPKFYNLEQLRELLLLSKETAFGLRNYTIISVLLGSALRVSELVGITLSDIDLEEEMIMVRRKRHKKKLLPAYIQRDALNVLMKYINFMYGHLADDWKELKSNYGELYVFSSTIGKTAITDRAVRGMVKSLAKKAESISEDEAEILSVHNFRHSYAIYGIRSGINLYAMMDLMGHSTVTSLKPYAKQTRDQIKEDMEKNPIARLI